MSQNPLASPRWAPALGAMRTFSLIPFDPSLACHQLLEAKKSGESRKLQGSPPGLGGLPRTLLGARPPTSASSLVSRPRRLGRPLSRPSPLLPSPRPFSSTPGPFDEPPWCTWTWGRQKRITGRSTPQTTPQGGEGEHRAPQGTGVWGEGSLALPPPSSRSPAGLPAERGRCSGWAEVPPSPQPWPLTAPPLSRSPRHQVDLQQWEQQLGLLGRAAGAADPRQPPDQAAAADTQLPLHWQLG